MRLVHRLEEIESFVTSADVGPKKRLKSVES